LVIVHFPLHATALGRKYPGAARDWSWQYGFPADRRSVDPRSGIVRRHHISDQSFQRALPARVGSRHPHRAGIARPFGRQGDDNLHARAQIVAAAARSVRSTAWRATTATITNDEPDGPIAR